MIGAVSSTTKLFTGVNLFTNSVSDNGSITMAPILMVSSTEARIYRKVGVALTSP
jgi:hypothetical protein